MNRHYKTLSHVGQSFVGAFVMVHGKIIVNMVSNTTHKTKQPKTKR